MTRSEHRSLRLTPLVYMREKRVKPRLRRVAYVSACCALGTVLLSMAVVGWFLTRAMGAPLLNSPWGTVLGVVRHGEAGPVCLQDSWCATWHDDARGSPQFPVSRPLAGVLARTDGRGWRAVGKRVSGPGAVGKHTQGNHGP
jgi:hypothetical protein